MSKQRGSLPDIRERAIRLARELAHDSRVAEGGDRLDRAEARIVLRLMHPSAQRLGRA